MVTQIDFARQWEIIGAEVLRATERVGASGRYILGKEVEGFEDALARRWGVRHAVGVGSGMDALAN
jgi:dTDP-4-amino-4,6-dideoxygalactose transaminase